jgi:phenylpropionate dioxygenase-like ring-hydroxylating dioxygenase large terminal subunit
VRTHTDIEPALWNDWHVVAESEQVALHGRIVTALFGRTLIVARDDASGAIVVRHAGGEAAPTRLRYGYVWACLGTPARDIATFAECEEADRWVVTAGSIGVAVSGLRAVENFLDLGHLAFVHAGYLGEEPHTAIAGYTVARLPEGGIIATGCTVYQPVASPAATTGFDVDYVYRVIRPYTVMLTKANPEEPSRSDMIALFVQPVSPERCVAHMLTAYLKHGVDAAAVRRFGQLIFCQDKPILENQLPRRLPLDPRAETAVRADAASAAYRQWLRETGIAYGAIPAAGAAAAR